MKTLTPPTPLTKAKSYPDFFFGATSRPLMIGLRDGFTYFDLRYCDCTGLLIEPDDTNPYQGINLRTANEVIGLANWLCELSLRRNVAARKLKKTKAVPESITLSNFSPEFSEESVEGHYDATELNLYGVWRNDTEGLCFHLAASTEVDPALGADLIGTDAQGIPVDLLPLFIDAIVRIADAMDDGTLDLTKEQPLG